MSMFLSHRLLHKPEFSIDSGRFTLAKNARIIESASGVRYEKNSSAKTCSLIGTIYGELGVVVPVDERMYRRLMLLQQIMSSVMETTCALNPREYRFLKSSEVTAFKDA